VGWLNKILFDRSCDFGYAIVLMYVGLSLDMMMIVEKDPPHCAVADLHASKAHQDCFNAATMGGAGEIHHSDTRSLSLKREV
jgi:hypothetical protein